MEFPKPFSRNGATPIIGEQQVPCVTFQMQVTPELIKELEAYAHETGLDGITLISFVFNRGLTAIRGDLLYAKEERDALREEGETPE